jgi:DMSO/TMAO reductase YedYZ molybdopterin-dependent catalytic subunit
VDAAQGAPGIEGGIDRSRPGTPSGPFRPGFFRSPLRGPWLTSQFARVLLVAVPLVFLTGLMSYAAYEPALPGNDQTPDSGLLSFYIFNWPSAPAWLYRVNQGIHVTVGLMAVPFVLAKLWSVLPKLFEWPPFRSPSKLLERLTVFGLVGGIIFELATGIINIQYWYPVPGGFYRAHLYGAWVFMACFVIHVALKASTMRSALEDRRLRDELRVGVENTEPEPADVTGLVSPDPAPASMSRRVLIGTAAAGAGLLGVMGAAQNIGGPVRSLGVLAPRGRENGSGPNGFPVNKTADYRNITPNMVDASWRLTISGPTGEEVQLSRSDLLDMDLHRAVLPIACVEGWSTGNQDWEGVRLADLALLVGAGDAGLLRVASLQQGGAFGSSSWDNGAITNADALLALGVNDAELSLDHGFPARIIVPASPGVRNTKWVDDMRFEADA